MTCFLIGADNNLLESIEAYLQANFFYIKVIEKLNSHSQSEKMLQKITPDLVLIDIVIGIEIPTSFLKKIKKSAIDTIAIIPNNDDIINLLEKHGITYVIKPIDFTELRIAINKSYIGISKEKELEQILKRIKSTTPKKRIAIPQEKQIQMIAVKDILYIEADINYCQIYIIDQKSICVSKTLKTFEQQLTNNPEFYRIHQSYLININYINKILKAKLPQVVMTNGDILTISRSKKTDFLKSILV